MSSGERVRDSKKNKTREIKKKRSIFMQEKKANKTKDV